MQTKEEQTLIWYYYKPRQTHAWNMVVLAWRALEHVDEDDDNGSGFEAEYCWENFIIRIWLYRTTVRTLTKISKIAIDAQEAVKRFDAIFDIGGVNCLKTLRDIVEHFDDYAAGTGHGPAQRNADLDPWRSFTKDFYERGSFRLERTKSYDAAIALQTDARRASDKFIEWLHSSSQ